MYAIIATGGKQYKVSEGDEIFVEKLDAEEGSAVTFDQVLAVSDNALKVGADVASASVSGTVVKQGHSVCHWKRQGKESHRLQVQKKNRLSQEERS